jgi:2-polyprenyl-6-methoxyphenol hydroxylase-like FAD-dependent oxidoreductase
VFGQRSATEDALNLGWKLALTISRAAASSLLRTYDTERQGHPTFGRRGDYLPTVALS